MSQKERILKYLKYHGHITSLDGFKFHPPIIRVGNRVNEMIQSGIPIKKERVNTENSHYTKYSLDGESL